MSLFDQAKWFSTHCRAARPHTQSPTAQAPKMCTRNRKICEIIQKHNLMWSCADCRLHGPLSHTRTHVSYTALMRDARRPDWESVNNGKKTQKKRKNRRFNSIYHSTLFQRVSHVHACTHTLRCPRHTHTFSHSNIVAEQWAYEQSHRSEFTRIEHQWHFT